MISPLEARYRQLARWYPRAWRSRNEDALVGVLLDVADAEGRDTISRGERMSMVSHGVSSRLDRVISRDVRDAGSTIALTVGSGIALGVFLMSTWAPWGNRTGSSGTWPETTGPFSDTGFLFAGLWIVALIAALAKHWGAGRVLLIVSVGAALVTPHIFTGFSGLSSVDYPTLTLLAGCAGIAVVGRPRLGLPTIGATGGWFLVTLILYVTSNRTPGEWLPSHTLWEKVGAYWYAALIVLGVALGLGIARYWRAAFTIILGLTPLAFTFVLNELRHDLIENGSAAIIAVPVGVGLLMLFLSSSGRLILADRRDLGPITRGEAQGGVGVRMRRG